ncbi:CD82 antigen-like [Babylonia areolata]|uniref:CD82 antigen-like n=1 Tax=Babylonia areolata TaxID=304850 RepID=UPI003FD609C8
MGIGEGVEGCYKCMKYTLVAFNLIVLFIGGTVLGLGIFTLVTEYGVAEMTSILGSDLYKAGTYLLIAGGCITVLISFFGCCGAMMESRCLLGLYFGVMLVLTIFFIAVCIIGFVFRKNITGHLQREVETNLIYKYGTDIGVTEHWDRVQRELKCCGVSGDKSSNTSWAIYKQQSHWFRDQTGTSKMQVPFSCCKPDSNLEMCVGRENNDNRPPKEGPPLNDTMEPNDALYKEGCYDKLDDFLDRNALVIGGVALAALFVMALGVIFSICLCVQIGRQGYIV